MIGQSAIVRLLNMMEDIWTMHEHGELFSDGIGGHNIYIYITVYV